MQEWYFNPVMFEIGPIQAHWYGFMYAISFIIGYLYLLYSERGKKLSVKERDEFVVFIILGIILGGRIGYILMYNLQYYFLNPAKIIAVWEGGMSFHGGLMGAALAIALFCRRHKRTFLELGDIVVSIAPVGLFFAKIGNFINAELYGKIASSLCINFPTDPANCRYPSQLLEALLEGIVLFILMTVMGKKTKKRGILSAGFLIFYGVFRIIAEFFREPDTHIGYLLGVITEGQLLSFLMMLTGGILMYKLYYAPKKK
jgi:phosphatidylglycerol---prolipoprotein diacylglyceryl transferase